MVVGGHGAVIEVLAGAERPTGAGEDHHPRDLGLIERPPKLLVHVSGEAIEPVGTVERDPRDAALELEVDRVVIHASE